MTNILQNLFDIILIWRVNRTTEKGHSIDCWWGPRWTVVVSEGWNGVLTQKDAKDSHT